MFAKAVLPVSVSSLFTKLSSEPWPGIPSLPAWGERPVGWAWHRGAAGFFGSVAPPLALMEKTEESVLLCICLGLAAMGSESGNEPVRGWQRFLPPLLWLLRNTREADADLAGDHPRCAAATWCHCCPSPGAGPEPRQESGDELRNSCSCSWLCFLRSHFVPLETLISLSLM